MIEKLLQYTKFILHGTFLYIISGLGLKKGSDIVAELIEES